MVELGAPAPQVRMVELDAPAPLIRLVELDAPAPQIIELDVPAPQVLMVELGAQDESDDPDDESVWDEDTDAIPPLDDVFGSEDEDYYGGRIEAARFRRDFVINGVPQDAEVAGAGGIYGVFPSDTRFVEKQVRETSLVNYLQDDEVSN